MTCIISAIALQHVAGVGAGAGGGSSNQTLMNCSTPGDALAAGTIDLDLQYQHSTGANDPEIISLSIFGDTA